MQVGCKSEVVYEDLNGLTNLMYLNLFIGNKTDEVIRDFQV